ncbi:MAG TPA: PP2C family protein-serine/threonine phosphatase [Acidobacteriaceae bacterium]|nr:PP2C family protein-serine/threonine phosphatase [Acidobacteriaceae bacterium]
MPSVPDSKKRGFLDAVWRRIPTGLGGGVFWLALWFALLWLLRRTSLPGQRFFGWTEILVGATLFALTLLLAVRLVRRHFLWSLRNKLILTYLLIGLAPVVMLVTLAIVLAYFATGQFSIHLADARMHQELDELSAQNAARVAGAARIIKLVDSGVLGPPRPRTPLAARGQNIPPAGQQIAAALGTQTAAAQSNAEQAPQTAAEGLAQATPSSEALPDVLRARLRPHSRTFLNGVPWNPPGVRPGAFQNGEGSDPLGLPAWAADLHDKEFHGLVLDGEDLYLIAIDQRHVEGKGILTSVTSLPVDGSLMDLLARGLGWVQLTGLRPETSKVTTVTSTPSSEPGNRHRSSSRRLGGQLFKEVSVFGGVQPLPVNFCDFRLPFNSTLDTTDWDTGQPPSAPAIITVQSRPSLLYRQLFGSSLGGIVNQYMRNGLIALCMVFGLIETLALWMAIRLFRALTASVHELYEATRRIDRGDFMHLIPSEHASKQDQLGDLSRSFNRMTGSLERLLIEQQEKERMQSELTIAQEVQANLFPHHVHSLPSLEVHGICRPARSVSGDYYDFFVFHGPAEAEGGTGAEAGVGIALGDISGKGISAALLMATLHSAVRAYRLASEDVANRRSLSAAPAASLHSAHATGASSAASAVLTRNGSPAADGRLFASPARILSLVNRHLYLSTQPEKYATLFLSHYDASTGELTYSNAGHLPPIILGRDGSVRRLDRGGTVVGLLPGAEYEDDSVQLRSGDIFIAYSDGVTEPENDFGEFGEARLIETVARHRDQPLHVISAQVMLALDAWIGAAEQPDDITLVLARQV